MNHFLAQLQAQQTAVDLGCGLGSFSYESYKCRIIGIDVSLASPQLFRDGSRINYIQAESNKIPLAAKSVDAVLSHHTMEHFTDYRRALQEIDRVLNDQGLLWIAVPNGYSLDDALYRRVYSGGGHVNRFTREGLINAVHELTRFRLKQEVDLYSSFLYLRKPTAEQTEKLPPSARPLYEMPDELNTVGILALNAITRVADKILKSHFSKYGWGFVFGSDDVSNDVSLPPIHTAYFNVCSKCGSGSPATSLRAKTIFGLGIYECPNCGQKNSFVAPPKGVQ